MALLNKLFPAKKKQNLKQSNANISCKPFPFTKEQVRVLLYRECDWRGRKLLFDSTAVHKVHLSDAQISKAKHSFVEVLDGFGYKFLRRNADTLSIGEMIFGAVAMAYRGTSLKVHWLNSPTRLLCTQVFISPLRTRTLQSTSMSSSANATVNNQLMSLSNLSMSQSCYSSWESSLNSLDAVERTSLGSALNCDSYTLAESSIGDSGYNASYSRSSGNITSGSSFSQSDYSFRTYSSASSRNSSRRRIIRNISTLFENELTSRRTSEVFTSNKGTDGRRAKLGLAVCVTLTDSVESEMQYYYMSHIPLIESMMNRLQCIVKRAYVEKSSFLSTMIDGVESATRFIYDLFRGPRIAEHFWLRLADSDRCETGNVTTKTNAEDRSALAQSFVDRLCQLLTQYDTKGTNFFISTLITATLTHHLGWVTTITSNKFIELEDSKSGNDYFEEIAKGYPYNVLWAQMSDLYGANGNPTTISKTIITGSDSQMLDEILNVLTYFIRCGEVQRFLMEPVVENDLIDSIMNNLTGSDDVRATNVCSFHSKHLPIPCTKLVQDMSSKYQVRDLGLCEPHAGLRNKDGLFNLRLCSQLHSQTCEYISSRHKLVENAMPSIHRIPNMSKIDEIDFDTKPYGMHPESKNHSGTILYHLKSNEDRNVEDNILGDNSDYSTNSDKNVTSKNPNSLLLDAPNFQCRLGIVDDSETICVDKPNMSKKLHFEKRSKESYPNLSALITKNSLGYSSTSQFNEENLSSSDDKTEVFFVLGENEELLGLNKLRSANLDSQKDNKIIPQVDKEFVYSRSTSHASDMSYEVGLRNVDEHKYQNDIESSVTLDTSSHISKDICGPDLECRAMISTPSLDTKLGHSSSRPNSSNISDEINLPKFRPYNEKSFQNGLGKNSSIKLLKKMIPLPLPKSQVVECDKRNRSSLDLTMSLFGGVSDHYIPDLVLQGITAIPASFEPTLRNDLALSTHNNTLFDGDVSESNCVLANIDKWEVQVISSHTYVFTNGVAGNVTAMSRLVANMLEAVQQMWKLKTSAEHCILYIEHKLRDMYLLSEALSEMLLSTDFCEMSWVTSSLGVEVADIPLLMSIASTHTPQVTRKYGLSFR